MIVALLYFAILLAGLVLVLIHHQPILLKGSRLVWLSAFALAVQLLFRPEPWVPWLIFFALAVVVSSLGWRAWIVFHVSDPALRTIIETRLRRVLVDFAIIPDGYRLSLPSGAAVIRIQRPLSAIATLTFDGPWQQNKLRVLKAFLAKSFDPVIPRLRIKV
jgi:hypothetical protein